MPKISAISQREKRKLLEEKLAQPKKRGRKPKEKVVQEEE